MQPADCRRAALPSRARIRDTLSVPRLLLATNNAGKVRELRRLLDGCGFEIVTPGDLGLAISPAETSATYAENAALKARAFAEAGDCLALADDSGLEVDALDGAPGVRSARFGGPELDDAGRVRLLLREIAATPDERRTARFRAVMALAAAGGEIRLFEGVQEGIIALAPRGDRGFGYDPIFVGVGGQTNGEIGEEEKDDISHRGQAARAVAAYLRGLT
jgi:XTP/dITP diphosphohydrolase